MKYDLIIIGGGAAGITAAVYAKRAGLNCLVIEKKLLGGQMGDSAEIENFPPFEKITGIELAERFGQMIKDIDKISAEVKKISEGFTVDTDNGSFSASAVIIANGASRRKLGVKGEDELLGRGVSYCAICDGNFFRGKTVCVVGGGNTAMEDAVYLSGICEKVYVFHILKELQAQKYLADRAKAISNIEFSFLSQIKEIRGSDRVEEVVVNDKTVKVDGVFIAIGLKPQNKIFSGMVSLDERGYIIAGEDCKTDHKGIFCAGDTRTKELRQIVTAMSDGAIAATAAEKYIHSL